MEDIKASEVIGELKKLRRMYEVLENAENMVRVLSEQEQRKTSLAQEIVNLEAEKTALDNKIEAMVVNSNKRLADAQHATKMAEAKTVEAEKRADLIVKKAHEQADALVAKAQAEVSSLKGQVKDYETAAYKARLDAEAAQASLKRAVAELESKKQEILKAFN